MTDFENLLIGALTESALAQTRLAKQIEQQTIAITNLVDALSEDDDVYEGDGLLVEVMNPRNG